MIQHVDRKGRRGHHHLEPFRQCCEPRVQLSRIARIRQVLPERTFLSDRALEKLE
jgi:hypothetical protein